MDAANDQSFDRARWLNKEFRHPEVRRLVQALFRVGTYANDPERQALARRWRSFKWR